MTTTDLTGDVSSAPFRAAVVASAEQAFAGAMPDEVVTKALVRDVTGTPVLLPASLLARMIAEVV